MKQNLARLVTEKSVLKALKNFELEKPSLEPSTKFDLEFNGNYYPPKEVVREAARIQGIIIDDSIHTLSGGDQTNIPLKDLGFIINNKKQFEMNFEILQKYWEDYKIYFNLSKSEHQEKYKWAVLKQVYEKWNWNAEDKAIMFKEAFEISGKKNLWMSGNFFPIGHTNWMFNKFREETIKQFENLFDESLPLIKRIENFVAFYDNKLVELRQLYPEKKINYHSHRDYRAIALYLTLQYPEKYFLYKFTMFKNFSVKLELPKIKAGDNNNLINFIELSNEVLDFIKKDTEFITKYRKFTEEAENFKDDSLHLLTQDVIYTIASHFNDGKKYWRIGSNDGTTSYYSEMLSADYISIGWNEIGDLEQQQIENKIEIKKLLSDVGFKFGTKAVLTRKSGEIFDFYLNASIDDVVTLMDGNSVLAIGKIISEYNYDESKPFAHYREVEWLKKDITNFQISDGVQTTFFQLVKKDTLMKIDSELKNKTSLIKNDDMERNLDVNESLNQILYGAPGTGKTYSTKKIAVEIIDNKKYDENDRHKILSRYNELVESKQIHFTTFHQSINYEDFIEGIKPVTIDKKVTYEVKDGIFKSICKIADPRNIYDRLFTVGNKFEKWEVSTINKEIVSFKKPQGGILILPIKLFENLYNFIERKNIDFSEGKIDKNVEIDRTEYPYLEKFFVSGYESLHKYVYKAFKNDTYNLEERKKYVLIIDEINRGNISAIFGELITLIEDDKRKGVLNKNDEFIQVELPYSNEKFSVPDNIYIIGTMNTADRSVEALDTALRRRFSFKGVHPKPHLLKHLKYQDVNLELLLLKINERIELLIDKDHQIGHSYFFDIKNLQDLKIVFKDKIIPLLEEYFYGDFGKIGLVLGGGFVMSKETQTKKILAQNFKYDAEFIEEKELYELVCFDKWNIETFQSIYI